MGTLFSDTIILVLLILLGITAYAYVAGMIMYPFGWLILIALIIGRATSLLNRRANK